jgi:hypothetical protein
MGDMELELAIFCNQARSQLGQDTNTAPKPLTYISSCLQNVLESEPSRIIKETRQTDFIQQLLEADAEYYSQALGRGDVEGEWFWGRREAWEKAGGRIRRGNGGLDLICEKKIKEKIRK